MTDNTNILILSSEKYKIFYDKCYVIAECLKPNRKLFTHYESQLMRFHNFYRDFTRGKDRPLVRKEKYIEIYFSWNSREKTYKVTFWFKTGFNPMKIENYSRNFILNVLRSDIENWNIYYNTEISVDFLDPEIPIEFLLMNLDKTLNIVYDKHNKFVKNVFVEGHFVKLYKKTDSKIRMEVTGSKTATNPLGILNQIINKKSDLVEVEYRNQIHFEELERQFQEMKKQFSIQDSLAEMKEDQITMFYQLDQIKKTQTEALTKFESNETELGEIKGYHLNLIKALGSLSQNQEKLIETQNKLIESQNAIFKGVQLMQENLQQDLENIYNQNNAIQNKITAESLSIKQNIKENGLGYKIKKFFKKFWPRKKKL